MTRSIVTGGCGFIGSHLVDILVTKGHDVLVIDDLSTGRLSNLAHQNLSKNLHIIEDDLSESSRIKEVISGCDYIFHLAALADIVPSIVEPARYFKANVTSTLNLLEAVRDSSVKKFVYAASSSCYGIPDSFPTCEDAEIRPQYPYAFTKWVGEQTALHWGRVYKIPVVSLRLFNVFGPRSRTSGTYGAVFGVFLAQKLANKPLTIVGDGTQTRDFTYVTDVAKAFYAAAHSAEYDQILNVGSGNTYSINYLSNLLGGESVNIPKRPGEPDCTFANIAKIKKLLNWKPEVNFETGVSEVLSRIEDWRDAPVWNSESIQEATREWFSLLGKTSE